MTTKKTNSKIASAMRTKTNDGKYIEVSGGYIEVIPPGTTVPNSEPVFIEG